MNDIKQLGKRLQKHLTQTIEGIPAELGKRESGGSYTVPTGRPNEVYARLYGDDNQLITAINVQTKIQARLPVLVQLTTGGRYRVVSTDPAKISQFLGADAPGASIPPVRGANVDAVWESYQFQPGRVHALNGSDLQVKMEPLPYFDTGLETTGNMAAVVSTITSGKKAWIGIAVDPVTSVLSFTKGTEYPLTIPLTRAMALAVPVPSGEIPLWAYAMRAGDTYIPVQKRSPDSLYFVDRRAWLQPQASANVTLPNFGAGVIKTLASGVASAGSDRHLIIAAESGAADDLIEITGLSVGDEVIIRADAGDTITIAHDDAGATDKTLLYNGVDLPLTGDQTLKLMKIEEGKVVQYVDEKGSGSGSGNIITVGTYAASRPVSPSAGDLYIPMDGRFTEVYQSSAWKFTERGRVFVKPSSLSWSWTNQSSASISSAAGVEYLYTSTSAGGAQNLNIREHNAPTAPYVITARIEPTQILETAAVFGLCFRESGSGKVAAIGVQYQVGTGILILQNDYANPTTSPTVNMTPGIGAAPPYLRIEDDNINRKYSYSYDGVHFTTLYSVGRTSFLTADKVGFFINPYSISREIGLTVLEWTET